MSRTYLIPFPSAAMIVPDGEREVVSRDAHAVIAEAKACRCDQELHVSGFDPQS